MALYNKNAEVGSRKNSLLVEQARALFVENSIKVLPDLAKSVLERLFTLVNQPGNAREMQDRRDHWLAFQKNGAAWVRGTSAAWSHAQTLSLTGTATPSKFADMGKFELMGNEAMEDKITASRLALRLLDFASWELNDLRVRVQKLDGISELNKLDIFRPEVLAQHLVEQWNQAGLNRDIWVVVQAFVQKTMAEQLVTIYHTTNEFLVQQGVMAEIDLRPLVKRTPTAASSGSGNMESGGNIPAPASMSSSTSPRYPETENRRYQSYGNSRHANAGSSSDGNPTTPNAYSNPLGSANLAAQGGNAGHPGRPGYQASSSPGGNGYPVAGPASGMTSSQTPMQGSGQSSEQGQRYLDRAHPPSGNGSVYEETRMQTAATPLARAKMRAQGVMGHLKRLISENIAGFSDARSVQASPQLAVLMRKFQHQQIEQSAIRTEPMQLGQGGAIDTQVQQPGIVYGQMHVEQAIVDLRERTQALKEAATAPSEKAVIEIVALMFQSILSEDRIPPSIRVWFARLQMPVLRVAIAEPEFFDSLQHPARLLIDRMGSCVLGFSATVSDEALEVEIRRIVQVIEQYPETGKRVFQLVYDEFDKFLSRFLTGKGNTARVASVAQQIEQKETMAIQYTIEMRNMLNGMPVREAIREYLFKVWAEVVAIAAMKNGAQHAQTLIYKRTAADLVWAASAKPNREDRAKVIADLPQLLQLLREGMSLLGLPLNAQDDHLKIISDILADAFVSKTDAIPPERVKQMAERLMHLEDYLSDEEDVGDVSIDTESLVTMVGIDSADVEVVSDGGSTPSEAMRAWARELQLGSWFSLEYNGKVSHVQFAWCSNRKQLHLFASLEGHSFLMQANRLAAYLQAGLLVPTEEEALTVRATRTALAKLDANPERLLQNG